MLSKLIASVSLLAVSLNVRTVLAAAPSNANQCNAAGNIVQNCGFDANFADYTQSGDQGFFGVSNLGIQDQQNQNTGNSVYMGSVSGNNNILTQQLTLQPYARYRVSFDVAVNRFDSTTHGEVYFDGQKLFDWTGNNNNGGVESTGVPAGQSPITQGNLFYRREYIVQVTDTDTADLTISVQARSVPAYVYFDNLAVVFVSAGAQGDPQFSGFLGQNYQVHGTSNTIYNVISSKHLQYNALFTFLSEGKCRAETECFAHAGNYFGEVGVVIKNDDSSVSDDSISHKLKFVDAHGFGGSTKDGHDSVDSNKSNDFKLLVKAGAVDAGMSVVLGDKQLSPSPRHIRLSSESNLYFPNKFEFFIETVDFTVKLENSDMFLNQRVSINNELAQQLTAASGSSASSVGSNEFPHGILGQTWSGKTYDNKWKFIQGTLSDYIVEDGIQGTQFKYNRFD